MRFKKLCALLLAVVLTLGLCSCSIGKKGKYEKAVDAVRNGRYQEAIESLESLDGYEDSAKYITYARALQAGDSGDYETAIKALEALNGFEKSAVYITSYTTLAYEAEQARMKSVYNQAIADVKSGNYDAAIAAFETLNDVSADKNPEYDTNPGNATKDKVFLLSIVEANKYFESDDDTRMCTPTDYATQQGAQRGFNNKVGRNVCWWWLRSPGGTSNISAAYVGGYDGSISGCNVRSDGAIRPCVRVRLF